MAEEALRSALLQTQSPQSDVRKAGEAQLEAMQRQPGYAEALVRLVERHCAGVSQEDKSLRTLGAIVFKNLVKKAWVVQEDEDPQTALVLPDSSKESIKGSMVHMMCVSPPEVQRQFSEALVIISQHDFPAKWPALVPDLVSKMSSQDQGVVLGVMLTANSILKRFRYTFKSDELFLELKYVLDNMQAALTELFTRTGASLAAVRGQREPSLKLLRILRLAARIFFSLNWQDLPEFFEDNMATWMDAFHGYLSYEDPSVASDDESTPGSIEDLQAAVVENANLYAEKYEEEFQPHLGRFATAVWGLLMRVPPTEGGDILATTCIRFLTSIVSKQLHVSLFQDPATLQQFVEKIVVPNLNLRESDEELFEDNPSDYISRDMEGSDSDTRRRVACDLVRGMCRHHEETTTRICSDFIGTLLQAYASDPNGQWRAKDAALQLLLAVSVRAQSASQGVSEVNKFINVMEVFAAHVLPEIGGDVNAQPIVRADCLKFVTTFRNQFSREQWGALMPLLVKHFASSHAVVATYAAMAVERSLTVKVPAAPGAKVTGRRPPLLGPADLAPFLEGLLTGLFSALDNPAMPENAHIMKAIMRCLSAAQASVVPVAGIVLAKQTTYLARACKNPTNPLFNHYLFESIAVLVGGVCGSGDAAAVDMFETALFPPFQEVLAQDVVEFCPYVFQILAQLLELRPPAAQQAAGALGTFTPAYSALFPPLLSPALWERKGNVPALTRLLMAYVRRDIVSLAATGHLPGILGVFQKLLASRATETQSFLLLTAIFGAVPPPATILQPFLGELFRMLLMRLQSSKSPKYVRLLTLFFSYVAASHGPDMLERCLDACQPGLLTMVMEQVWLPQFSEGDSAIVLDGKERKIFAVGMTELLSTKAIEGNAEKWGRLLAGIMFALSSERGRNEGNDGDELEGADEVAYDATFSRLHFAITDKAGDLLPNIPSPESHLVNKLVNQSSATPGRYGPAAQAALSSSQFLELQNCFSAVPGATLK
jgi:exportin-2 (importin alpha re-exporter)